MLTSEALDSETSVWYLEVESSKIVLLQTIFESYEGVGTVRTLNRERGLVCILSTPSQAKIVEGVLESLHEVIPWSAVNPEEAVKEVLREGNFSRTS